MVCCIINHVETILIIRKETFMNLETIKNYKPRNEQEKTDQNAMLEFAKRNPDSFLRTNLMAHFTNSAIITNEDKNKVLFINHLIYQSWGWVGGHNDGNEDFLDMVLQEAGEETGVTGIKPLLTEPVSLDNIYVPYHIKNKKFVGDHIHMNLTYLLVADETKELIIKKDENSGVRWFDLDDVLNHVSEPRMVYIYKKVFEILKQL